MNDNEFHHNPLPLDTVVEGVVPRAQLPIPPRGHEWYLRQTVRITRRKTNKYTYRTHTEKIITYYKYRGKRKRRTEIVTTRHRYYVYAAVKKKEKWWVLSRLPAAQPLKKTGFVKADDYVAERMEKLGIDPADIQHETEFPFNFTEPGSGFNFYAKRPPRERTYDMMFLYYVISVYKLREQKLIFRSSSFDLDGEYTIDQIAKIHVPEAVKTTEDRLSRASSPMSFVGYVGFSVVTRRALESGKD